MPETQPTHSPFDAESTMAQVAEGVSLRGKRAAVTGAGGGLGRLAARQLAAQGAQLILLGRRQESLDETVMEIAEHCPQAPAPSTVACDLADADSVRAAASTVSESCDALHVLVNNAGIMACPLLRSAEGFELQFATNHLGHWRLTAGLMAVLRAGAPARIINLSSAGHRMSDVHFDDVHFDHRPYDKWQAYGQSKTANILFSVEFDRRFAAEGLYANAVHPGAIMTDLGRHLSAADLDAMSGSDGERQWSFKSPEAGAATTVWAACSPLLEGIGGLYLEDCGVGQPTDPQVGEDVSGYAEYAFDAAAARRLWTLSEQLTGQRIT